MRKSKKKLKKNEEKVKQKETKINKKEIKKIKWKMVSETKIEKNRI